MHLDPKHNSKSKIITLGDELPFLQAFVTNRTDADPTKNAKSTLINLDQTYKDDTSFNSFPFSDFRYYFTLFSKCFSSFPHGTCSLSVSRQYLALEGIYLPLRAALPNNSTRWKSTVRLCTSSHERVYHPQWSSMPGNLCRRQIWYIFYRLQFDA